MRFFVLAKGRIALRLRPAQRHQIRIKGHAALYGLDTFVIASGQDGWMEAVDEALECGGAKR